MPAESILFLVFLVFAVAIPLALWALIVAETSNPTVLDREEAERRAIERGGRGGGRNRGAEGERTEPGPDGGGGLDGGRSRDEEWGRNRGEHHRDR